MFSKNEKKILIEEISLLEQNPSSQNDPELSNKIIALKAELEQVESDIVYEENKFRDYKTENLRRKHNYMPFLFNMLQILAEKNMIPTLIDKAKEKKERTGSSNNDDDINL